MDLKKMKVSMVRLFVFLILLIFLNNCSIDTKSGIWNDKNKQINKKKNSEISFNEELSFDQYKENVILYGKKSKFPKLDD